MMVLKKGTQVKVISGKDKGKSGEILEINRSANKVKIKTINMIKINPSKSLKLDIGKIEKKKRLIFVYFQRQSHGK